MPDKIRSKEFIIFSIFLFLITGIFLFCHKSELFTVSAAGENWLSGWSKRAAVTVTNSSGGVLTNYQILTTVAYDSDMQVDFDDLRFTSSDGSTVLDYWIESKTDSSTAKVWVEIPSLAIGANTIYMYYGNSLTTTTGNGTNTFDFFDDFSAASIDTAKWTITDATGWSIVSGELKGTNTTGRIKSIATFSSGVVLRTKSRRITLSGNGYTIGGFWLSTADSIGFLHHPGDHYRNNSTWVSLGTTVPASTNLLAKISVKSSSVVDISITNYDTGASYNNIINISNAVTAESITLGKRYDDGYTGQAYEAYWDWIFVHKYSAVEPTSSFGSEEVLVLPILAQVTAVPTPTADTTPNYTFSSTKAGTINYSGNCSSATTSAIAGNNTITFNVLASGTHSNCKISVTDSYGAQSALLSVNTFIVDAVAPTLAQVTAVPTPIVYVKPSYTFSSNENGTITYAGDCSSATTTAIAGNNTITFNTLAAGTHSNCTIKVTDNLSNQSASLAVNSFTINSYNSTTYTSANLSCFVTSGTCTGTTIFNLYDYLGGHAELSTQANYLFKVCCTGIGISNSCSGNYDTVLKLSGNINAHTEKKSQSNYSGNNVCLHSNSMSVFCDYNTSCSAIGSDFVCLASISGDTNAHIGDCSSPYTTKVCCRIGATINDCSSKVTSNKSIALKDADIQLCSGADITNTSDPCYSICWKGVGTPNLSSSDWKCSVCYDSGNNPVSCSTAASTTIEWVMPTGYVTPTDYTLVSGTLTSANPVVRFVAQDDDRIINLNINSYGTSCSGQNSGQFVPTWREISPF